MIRAGFLALNNIADFLRVDRDPAPGTHTPASVDRVQFDALLDQVGHVPSHWDGYQISR